MKVMDLGQLNEPVLLFGGPYSNLQALQAVLKIADERGVRASHLICTGDLAAYCAHPSEVIDLVQQMGIPVVAGNCEKQLAENALDCGCGFDEGSTCDLLSAGWYAHANAEVSSKQRAWMGQLPDMIVFQHNGKRIAVLHGGLSDISRFIWSSSEDAVFREEIALVKDQVGEIDTVIAGHSGLTFEKTIDGVQWVNAGVIGMPENDGLQATRFTMLSGGAFAFEQLDYDATAANQAMQQAGLTQGYDKALLDGHWPSEDVLPLDLRRS